MVKKYGELYLEARRALRATEGENASFIARELLSYASGKSAAAVMADRELYASEATADTMQMYTERSLRGEPLAYILGKWSFYGLELTITPDVLIPRDDTMAVTELAIETLRTIEPPQRVLDLCTGSGCIGLAIAHQVESARVTLADVSPEALRIAKLNLTALKMAGRVNAFQADAREPAPKFWGQFDLIVSNPPYVTAQEMTELEPSVRDHEPHLALDGGEDGLDFYRAIVENFTPSIHPGGWLCFEFGFRQHVQVGMILTDAGYRNLRFAKDSGGVIRAVRAQKISETNV